MNQGHLKKRNPREWKSIWPYLFVSIILFLSIPIWGILSQFSPDVLARIPEVIWSKSSLNTLLLMSGSGAIALVLGISSAWFVTFKDVPLKKWIDWAMVLPLTIPPYVASYVYKGIFDPFGTMDQWFGFHLDIANLPMLCLILGAVLFPYVYTPLRASLKMQNPSLLEASHLVGIKRNWALMKTILPMHKPAISGGLMLVVLEALNEYGAPAYFGIPTYTTEIIRHWNPTALSNSISHAIIALLLVGFILYLETKQRNKYQISEQSGRFLKPQHHLVWISLIVVSVPLLLGFVFPIMQMIAWAAKSADYILEYEFLSIAGHTLWLSASTALILLVSSTVLSFFIYQFRRSKLSKWSFAVNLGYAIPAAIIGIGILIPIAFLNKTYDVLVTGTSGILILAYCFRYQAISFNGIDGAFRKLPISQHEAALTLGKSRTGSLFSILIPQVKRALLGATLLVFVDITKELPLTMLFQRFNQETLAVKAFIMMDTDGAFYKASIPSLLIVLLGVLAVILFRILDKSDK